MGRLTTLATYIGFAVMVVLVGSVTLGILGELHIIREGDAWFNCHLMRNMTCGPDAPWHGFVGASE